MPLSKTRALLLFALLLFAPACGGGGGGFEVSKLPKIQVTPTELNFERRDAGSTFEQEVEVQNTGDGVLRLRDVHIEYADGALGTLGPYSPSRCASRWATPPLRRAPRWPPPW